MVTKIHVIRSSKIVICVRELGGGGDVFSDRIHVFEIPQVPFEFEFESQRPNGNLATKQSLDYHFAISEVSRTAKCHSAV